MNGDDDKKPESNQKVIMFVVFCLCFNATVGVGTLSYCLVTGKEVNVALFTAFVAIVNYVLGVISGMLAKTSATPTAPAEAKIVNPPTEPIPTDPVK
jgi:uncharacterized membrane protein YfbV (UPF0208 family)